MIDWNSLVNFDTLRFAATDSTAHCLDYVGTAQGERKGNISRQSGGHFLRRSIPGNDPAIAIERNYRVRKARNNYFDQ